VPGQHETHVLTAIEAIPGAALGYGVMYWIGARQEEHEAHDLEPLPG
jgi:hypothetical protein